VRIHRNREIEELAAQRLAEFERDSGRSLCPPIPIDLIAEKVLGLDFLWEPIDELPGETIFGGLVPKKRLIILNEKHKDRFEEKPGLERSTKGHEMGHWDIFVDKASLNHPTLFDPGEEGPFAYRNSPAGDVAIIKMLQNDPEGRELLRKMQSRGDEPDEARAVNRYAAALSMPPDVLRAEVMRIDRTQWPNLYDLKDKFDVTISALVVRLQQLDLLYVDKERNLYESKAAASGQMTLGF
jgi:hypothetical protein